jgi:hypothetical protein
MRTATPISTCSVIAERCGSSATPLVISTPAVHRAGVHHERVGLGLGQPLWRQAVERMIFARGGMNAPSIRSF